MARNRFDSAVRRVNPQRMRASFALQETAIVPQVLQQGCSASRSANIYGNGFTLSFRREAAQSVIPSIFQHQHYGGGKAVARLFLGPPLPVCAGNFRTVGNDPFSILFIYRSELVPHDIPDNVIVTFNLQLGRPTV